MKKECDVFIVEFSVFICFRTKWESEKWGNRWCFDGLV